MVKKPTYEELEQRVKELEKKIAELRIHDDAAKGLASRYKRIFESVPVSIEVVDDPGNR